MKTMTNQRGIFFRARGTALVVLLLIQGIWIFSVPPCVPASEASRPKVGLVLSGGGARGAAHVGVLKVLEELRIPIDCIAGTSMGAITGGLYATGLSAEALETIVERIDWDDALRDESTRKKLPFRKKEVDRDFLVKASPGFRDGGFVFPPGVIQGQRLNLILKTLTLPTIDIQDFDELSIPYRAVATDIGTGKAVVLGSGDLATAMRASMSVPGVFAPVMIEGALLVDGGVSNNLPVDVVRSMGAEVIIVVDISTPLMAGSEIKSAIDITEQITTILTRLNTEAQIATLTEKDIFIQPPLDDIGSTDFDRTGEAMRIGEETARSFSLELQKLSLSREAYDAHLATRTRFAGKPVTVDYVQVLSNARLSDRIIEDRIRARLGEDLDPVELNEDIESIYGIDIFERVDYSIATRDRKRGLIIEADRRSWGPDYVRFGLRLENNFQGESAYDLGFSYTRTDMNDYGGEWRSIFQGGTNPRIFSELYQPLDRGLRYFVRPSVEFRKRNVNEYIDGDWISQYRLTTFTIGLEGGRELGTWGRLGGGIDHITGNAELRIGDPSLDDYSFTSGEIYLFFAYDTLDNIFFPHHGADSEIRLSLLREELGSDDNLETLALKWLAARDLDRNSLVLSLNMATSFANELPPENLFPLGGFLNLSGYNMNELYGSYLGLAKVMYLRELADFAKQTAYLGVSLEAGNVWNESGDVTISSLKKGGSIFLGFDSYVGPIYLATGFAEGGRTAAYLFVGAPFY